MLTLYQTARAVFPILSVADLASYFKLFQNIPSVKPCCYYGHDAGAGR
jgi:hypothetical protein